MLRLAAVVALLVGALSVLMTASAFTQGQPASPASFLLVNVNQGQIKVEAGSGDVFQWVTGAASPSITVNMTKGVGGATGRYLDNNATYTLRKVIKVTNLTPTNKSITLTADGTSLTLGAITGYVNGSTTATSAPFTLAQNGYVEINLKFTTGATGTNNDVTFIVNAN